MNRFVILSGCSGGGKSTLLSALAAKGYRTVTEPGRRIVERQREQGGRALPWIDMAAFAREAIALSLEDRQAAASADNQDWIFFDRGLIDAASVLEITTGETVLGPLSFANPYHRTVFLTPPWPEIYGSDEDRKHGFEEAVREYERLSQDYPRLGYTTIILPKTTVEERVRFILSRLEADR